MLTECMFNDGEHVAKGPSRSIRMGRVSGQHNVFFAEPLYAYCVSPDRADWADVALLTWVQFGLSSRGCWIPVLGGQKAFGLGAGIRMEVHEFIS